MQKTALKLVAIQPFFATGSRNNRVADHLDLNWLHLKRGNRYTDNSAIADTRADQIIRRQ